MHYIFDCIIKTFKGDISLFLLFPVLDFGIDSGSKEYTEGELQQAQVNYREGKHPLHPWFICQQW
jgi:hypothetical protein